MNRSLKLSLALAAITFVAIVLTEAFQWIIADRYTGLGVAFLGWILGYVFLASVLLSLFTFCKRVRHDKWRSGLPLVLNALTVLLSNAIPWTDLYLDYLWWHNERSYAEAVSLVQTGRLRPVRGQSSIKLPAIYSGLSTEGTIGVEGSGATTRVFFTTFEGILGHHSGYLYVPDSTKPPVADHKEYDQVVKKKPHWYFVASG